MMEKSSADPRFAQITENYKRIRENIAAAAEKSGRMPGDIRFMAVTKTVEPVYINHALSLGISLIGENKVQEYLGKREYLNLAHCEKHLIGHLQTNKEESKTGMAPAELEETACAIAQMPGIQVCGLMAIPPICEEESVLRGFFSDMRRFFVDMKAKKIDNINMDILSMGMSGDYVQAIEEGANLVRVGSALFGARVY